MNLKGLKRIIKYLPEFDPKVVKRNAWRFLQTNTFIPKERKAFLSPENLETITQKSAVIKTDSQPKQVVFDPKRNIVLVSCMKGCSLQVFQLGKNRNITLKKVLNFKDQCVEVTNTGKFAFVTTTNFERCCLAARNKLWIINLDSLEVVSHVNTGGNWSKFIAVDKQRKCALVSNWYSHDISVINISDPSHPKLTQIIKWGESPRGISFTSSGNKVIIAGFHSGNIGELKKEKGNNWIASFTSPPFDSPKYPGNMRHILITKDDQWAIISNLGRNLIHWWSISEKRFVNHVAVGRSPNSIDFIGKKQYKIAVSCRDSDYVYILDTTRKRVIGKSEKTGLKPTGICQVPNGFLVTCFGSNTLEWHQLIKNER